MLLSEQILCFKNCLSFERVAKILIRVLSSVSIQLKSMCCFDLMTFISEWMKRRCNFVSFLTAFQSYQGDERMIMKGSV